MLSQPSTISSSSPTTSGSLDTLFTSSDLTRFNSLHKPRQRSARVDCAERRDLTCERRSRPRLNSRSTSTDVAVSDVSFCLLVKGSTLHTRDSQVVDCHARQMGERCTTFTPPSNWVSDMLHVHTEVVVELGAQADRLLGCKCREIVEDVVTLRFI